MYDICAQKGSGLMKNWATPSSFGFQEESVFIHTSKSNPEDVVNAASKRRNIHYKVIMV